MQIHDLVAANTYFEPKKQESVHTFLHTKQKDTNTALQQDDNGEYVGAEVVTTYKNERITGRVEATYGENTSHAASTTNTDNAARKWIVKYQDGYVARYTRKELQKLLVVVETEKIGKQLDYILVSARRKSCILHCRPRWGPEIHRDIHGHRNDHALVECKWRWRLRTNKREPIKDYSPLYLYESHTDEKGRPTENPTLTAFEDAVQQKMRMLEYSQQHDSTTEMYDKFCKAVAHATETVLPDKKPGSGIRRKTSERTKNLYEKRTCMKGNKADYTRIQKKIKESCLRDYEDWVGEWADCLQESDQKGDTKGIYQAVKALARKQEKPPTNISKDANGKVFSSAEEIACAWEKFLKAKFSATEAEAQRPAMKPLQCTKNSSADMLTAKEINAGIAKMSNGKACGPDQIPASLYKRSEVCRTYLHELLQKIWVTEEVPRAFACATFVMLYKQE